MRKPLWSLLMISVTGMIVLVMLAWRPSEELVQARIVTVERGDVHQVVAITGRITYTEEQYAYATGTGRVAQICVEEGQRVGSGAALVRLEMIAKDDIVSGLLSRSEALAAHAPVEWIEENVSAQSGVIRAEDACTVRQLFVDEGTMLTAGMPVARVTSHQQEIICHVVPVDADKLVPGMWAWLSADGDSLGFAAIQSVEAMAADPMTGLFYAAVKLVPEQHIELPEGAAVDVDVYLAGSDDALSLPVEAITERGTVWWVKEGRCTEIQAEIVLTDEMRAWVNLPEGMAVAVGEFKEGQRIMRADE